VTERIARKGGTYVALRDTGVPPSLTQEIFDAIDPTKAPTAQSATRVPCMKG
jgi:hypothetical protein